MASLLRLAGGAPPDTEFLTPFRVEHALVGHPLLQREAIATLADRLGPGHIELGSDSDAIVMGLDYQRQLLDGSASAAVQALENEGRSLYFYNIESDAQAAPLVEELIEIGRGFLGVEQADIVSKEGYLFISGDTAVTGAHVDHECNFLLVTQGHKRVWIASVGDPEGEIALEALHSGRYGACGARPQTMHAYELEPGQGVFIPPRAAHYVENGPGPCTALSVVFLHRLTRDEVPIYAWNARLRTLGIDPTAPGRSPWRDRLKRDTFTLAHAIWDRRPHRLGARR